MPENLFEKNDEQREKKLKPEIINVTIIIQLIMAMKNAMVLPSTPVRPKTPRSLIGSVRHVSVFDLATKKILKTLQIQVLHEHLAMEIQTKKNPSVSSNLKWSKRERKALSNTYLI